MSQNTADDDVHADRVDRVPNPGEQGKWISALLALLGLWMIGQALALDLTVGQLWNDIAVGVVLFAIGVYNYSRRSDERLASMAAAAIATLIGLWLIAAPFVLGAEAGLTETANDVGFWNDVLLGLITLLLGVASAYVARGNRSDASQASA